MCVCLMWKFVATFGAWALWLHIVGHCVTSHRNFFKGHIAPAELWMLLMAYLCNILRFYFLAVGSPRLAVVHFDVVLTCFCQTIQICSLICIEWNMSRNLFCWKFFKKKFGCQNWNVKQLIFIVIFLVQW